MMVARTPPRSLGRGPPQVLVVEDEVDFRETIEMVLGMHGLAVTAVGDGASAIGAARRCQFDLVITDLLMPGMSGIDTISALKELDPGVPVIVATGYATAEIAQECTARGAGHLLRKPFDLQQLVGLVLGVLGFTSSTSRG